MNSVLGVVVSYHPSAEILENIQALLEQVTHVVVVDNASSDKSREILARAPQESVSFIYNTANLGVATGFNQGMRWGLERQYDYFLLMDQDSRPVLGMVSELLKVLESFLATNKLALVGPHHEDFERKIKNSYLTATDDVPLLITSGCLISLQVVNRIGLYDERLFIDHVDHDYCLRLQKTGGVCLRVNNATLLHSFGDAQVRSFFGLRFFLQNYSAFRRYHMMRNRIVLYKRYGIFSGAWIWIDLNVALKDLIKMVFFESQKSEKLLAVARGIRDGLIWRE